MLGPRDRENPMRETTAYRAISISSHMVGFSGHCEKVCSFENGKVDIFTSVVVVIFEGFQ